jgi:hypothetical protein
VLVRTSLVLAIVTLAGCGTAIEEGAAPEASTPAQRVHVGPDSDERAVEIAQATVEKMGGWEAWDAARFVSWNFFGRRRHYWDRLTGDLRLEYPNEQDRFVVLMNVDTKQGRVWKNGEEVTDPEQVGQQLQRSHEMWINDSYWMFMPYKLLDPGVTLKYSGEGVTEDGRAADVLELTFEEVGYTPQNRYEVLVARESGLVEQWNFFATAGDAEPQFKSPWTGWRWFGGIMLATDHGQGRDWDIAVHATLPRAVFESPEPVAEAG